MPNRVPKFFKKCKPLHVLTLTTACQKRPQKKPIILIGFSQFNKINGCCIPLIFGTKSLFQFQATARFRPYCRWYN